MAKTVNGTVKWFSSRKGYGFITDNDGVDYFVHFSQIQMEGYKKLSAGQKVYFDTEEDTSGRHVALGVIQTDQMEQETEQ